MRRRTFILEKVARQREPKLKFLFFCDKIEIFYQYFTFEKERRRIYI